MKNVQNEQLKGKYIIQSERGGAEGAYVYLRPTPSPSYWDRDINAAVPYDTYEAAQKTIDSFNFYNPVVLHVDAEGVAKEVGGSR